MGELVRRRLGTVVVLGVLLVLFSANRVAVVVTDYWWFQAREYPDVFTSILGTRVLLGVVFGVALAVLIAGNLAVARRVRPFFVPSSPQQAQVQRYREMADPYLPWLIAAIAIVFGVTAGLATSNNWESFLLWRNGVEVGTTDPTFDTDIGFYLFELPFLTFVQSWLFTSLVLATLLSVGAHYLLGGIRPEADEKLMPAAKVHLSVLLAAILAVRTWGYWLDRFRLNYSDRGGFTGAAYTDVTAELQALNLLLIVSAVAIVLVLVSLRRRGFLLPGAAIALLLAGAILLQGAYPAIVQRLQVDPQQLAREEPYIAENLTATRAAYGLVEGENVELSPFSIANDLDEADVIENDVTLRNVRLWDPGVLETTYQELQALRPYYEFNRVSIDRYEVDGELRQVMLATRDLSELQPEADNWQNRHITFTHGYGLVASQVNTANSQGQPVFLTSNIPPTGEDAVLPDEQPGIYFGEFANPAYSLVRTAANEVDFEDPETLEQELTRYDGRGGVDIGSFVRRVAFALRFADYNLVLTNLIEDDSAIIFEREVRARVAKVAPFLTLDGSPYPVVDDGGRVQWVVDAYTTSDAYPYSQRRVLSTAGVDEQQVVNYVRNSVKVVVDAYDGDLSFYRVQDDDPVLDSWEGAFPGLFQSLDEADPSVVDNFRYPQDLFRLQAQLYTTYHIPEAEAFFNRADAWAIPRDPVAAANQGGASAVQAGEGGALEPYYLLMRLPGEEDEEFVLIQPYLAAGRDNMVAWLAGRSDPEHLGQLLAVRFPSDQLVLGPAQAQTRIEQEEDISEYITLRTNEGTRVVRGNLQVLPIADSILYVEPMFLRAGDAEIPELNRVALVLGERTAFDRTFAGALGQLLGIDVPESIADAEGGGPVSLDDPTEGDGTPTEPGDGTEEPGDDPGEEPGEEPSTPPSGEGTGDLLADALAAFAAAEEALRDGDLATYQEQIEIARDLLEQAAEEQGVDGLEGLADAADDGDAGADGGGAEGTEDGEATDAP